MAYRVRVYDREIAAMFSRPGEVGRIAERDSRQIIQRAEIRVPKGGAKSMPSAARPIGAKQIALAGAHRRRVVNRSATMSTQYLVENTSPHAEYVHEGTDGPIYPIRGGTLRLHLPGRITQAAFVLRGQHFQPWLRLAADSVLAKYGVRSTPL